jgi:hypothetical protein
VTTKHQQVMRRIFYAENVFNLCQIFFVFTFDNNSN